MTAKSKLGCGIGLLTFLVRLPITYAGTILLYQHVDAPLVVWVLLWISIPIVLLIEVASSMFKAAVDEE